MKTLNNVVLFVLVLFVLSVGSVACGDSDSPTAPSTTMADAPPSFGPSTPVRTTPASFDADNLRPDARGWNAYDFTASWDGRMLRLVLVEDRMRNMREASKPHRNRLITVGTCPVEPHHSLQACGDPIWQGSMRLAGRLELDPIPLASCEGWIVVNAAELSDDKYDGWRNAPCPTTDDDAVSSDGTGSGWPEYPPLPRPMADHSLPFSYGDPRGDVTLCCNDERESYSGSRPAVDQTGVTFSDQDADGWITVTFTLASAFDLDAIVASEPELPESISSASHSLSVSFPDETFNALRRQGEGWMLNQFGQDWSADIRLPTATTGRSFSFGIRPSPESRGGSLWRYGGGARFGVAISHSVNIYDDRFRLARLIGDSIRLPHDFTLPNLP